jgi:4-carboxymuconolactone decarboxylase
MSVASELENKGREMRTRLWAKQALKGADEFLKNFDQGSRGTFIEQLFGEIWNRPGLPTKARSMITVAVLMAVGRGQELRLHMRGALNLGITPEELKEIIVHVSQYSGVPTAIEGIRAFTEVTTPAK